MKLIVGLGNPGQEYSTNRHNIGFLCISHIAKLHRIEMDKKQGKARVGAGNIAGNQVILAKPQTYMNLSGESVVPLMQRYLIKKEDLIVIHDDLDLPLGKIRIRQGSSAGGHNGIKSIIASLGAQDFVRLRVGISRPQSQTDSKIVSIVDYVLGDFTDQDKPIIEETLKRVGEAVACWITAGLNLAMNKYNTDPKPKTEKKDPGHKTDRAETKAKFVEKVNAAEKPPDSDKPT
jgi:PTH1 family peptidyl-tRNA hydrolase